MKGSDASTSSPRQLILLVTMNTLTLPSLDLLKKRYYISEDSPSGLRNKIDIHSRAKKDAVAGCINGRGYYQVSVEHRTYRAHRIVYYLQTGIDPVGLEVDHKNHNTSDTDLRQATRSENGCNRRPNEGRKYKGVFHEPLCVNNPYRCTHTKR